MTTADNADQRRGAARQGLLARYPVTFYFVIAYGFSWLVWVPLALSKNGAGLQGEVRTKKDEVQMGGAS